MAGKHCPVRRPLRDPHASPNRVQSQVPRLPDSPATTDANSYSSVHLPCVSARQFAEFRDAYRVAIPIATLIAATDTVTGTETKRARRTRPASRPSTSVAAANVQGSARRPNGASRGRPPARGPPPAGPPSRPLRSGDGPGTRRLSDSGRLELRAVGHRPRRARSRRGHG